MEREIATAGGQAAGTPGPHATKQQPLAFIAPSPTRSTGRASDDPDLTLGQFATEPTDPAAIKRGCVSAFVAGFVALAAALGAVWYFFYR